jgi:hypothetical protein
MLNSPSGLDVRNGTENKSGLCNKSRRLAETNPERHPAPGFLRDYVTAPSQRRFDALQTKRFNESLDAACLIEKSPSVDGCGVSTAPRLRVILARAELDPIGREDAAIVYAPRERLLAPLLNELREKVRPVVASSRHW